MYHAGAVGNRDKLVDSEATCHMCNDKEQFSLESWVHHGILLSVMEVSYKPSL